MIYLYLGNGFEEIEAVATVDILKRADIEVETVSITDAKEVEGAHGIRIVADRILSETLDGEGMILPGGLGGMNNLMKNSTILEKIQEYNKEGKLICAICAAPVVLAKADILNGKKVTCYPGFEEELKGATIESSSVVVYENIVTSKGPGTSFDFALKIVEILRGEERVNELKKEMIMNM